MDFSYYDVDDMSGRMGGLAVGGARHPKKALSAMDKKMAMVRSAKRKGGLAVGGLSVGGASSGMTHAQLVAQCKAHGIRVTKQNAKGNYVKKTKGELSRDLSKALAHGGSSSFFGDFTSGIGKVVDVASKLAPLASLVI